MLRQEPVRRRAAHTFPGYPATAGSEQERDISNDPGTVALVQLLTSGLCGKFAGNLRYDSNVSAIRNTRVAVKYDEMAVWQNSSARILRRRIPRPDIGRDGYQIEVSACGASSILNKIPVCGAAGNVPSKQFDVIGVTCPRPAIARRKASILSFFPGRFGSLAADRFRGSQRFGHCGGFCGSRGGGPGKADARLIAVGELDTGCFECRSKRRLISE